MVNTGLRGRAEAGPRASLRKDARDCCRCMFVVRTGL